MTGTPKEAMILLYPSSKYNHLELRAVLSDFCQLNNIAVIDIISFMDEYDYLAIQRLSKIIKYNTKPIYFVTNNNLSMIMSPLIFQSLMEIANMASSFDMVLDFLREFKEDSGKRAALEDFRIIVPEEIERVAERMSQMQYSVKRLTGEAKRGAGIRF